MAPTKGMEATAATLYQNGKSLEKETDFVELLPARVLCRFKAQLLEPIFQFLYGVFAVGMECRPVGYLKYLRGL